MFDFKRIHWDFIKQLKTNFTSDKNKIDLEVLSFDNVVYVANFSDLTLQVINNLKCLHAQHFQKLDDYHQQMLIMDDFVYYDVFELLRRQLLQYKSKEIVEYAIDQMCEAEFLRFYSKNYSVLSAQ